MINNGIWYSQNSKGEIVAQCPFATFEEISGAVGPFAGGPFKIVHHTTEGSTYAGAKAAYKAAKSDPHFTVLEKTCSSTSTQVWRRDR